MVRRHWSTGATAALLVVVVGSLSGCSDAPSPVETSPQVHIVERPSRGKVAGDAWATVSRRVTRGEGGVVVVDDEEIGRSSLTIPAAAVPTDTTITMRVRRHGPVMVEFFPEGIRFDQPVTLLLSYRGADLGGVDSLALRIFYYNEHAERWERVPMSTPDRVTPVVRAFLWHFSQYAVGSEE